GVHLVGGLVILSNAALAAGWGWLRWRGPRALGGLVTLAGLLLLAGGWAVLRLGGVPAPAEARRLVAAVVQGNLDEKAYLRGPAATRWVLERLLRESRAAVERGARLVVWPEGSLPEALPAEGAELGVAAGLPAPLAAELVIGAVGRERGGEARQWNSAFLLSGQLRAQARYDKVHLVPFGEYVPLGAILPWEWFVPPGVRFFTPGEEPRPLPAQAGRLGLLICYEAIFPELARAQVGQGAELLVNITNDSWFGRTSAPWQHLAMSRMRAVEAGRYLLRAANTGVSAVVDPRGRVLAELGLGLARTQAERVRASELEPPGWLSAEVALLDGRTPYAWLGDLPAWACAAFAAGAWGACALRAWRARRQARRQAPLSA
ncbi:MAG TPA: apolipoprotein N-acyltransferase, partial [Myxococcota bacterium]|nr:apolipoprotein N-acyltransferase [Myxococcota bacterium]